MCDSIELPIILHVVLDEVQRVESIERFASHSRCIRLHSLVVPMFEAVECMRLELGEKLIGEQYLLRHAHYVWQIAHSEYTHLRREDEEILIILFIFVNPKKTFTQCLQRPLRQAIGSESQTL